jgi:saccharopine dehydrogenase-like NADP-dependent oxidoreductase
MNVCVVGGAGKMAEAAIRDLIESDEVEAVVLADLNEAGLAARAAAMDSKKLSAVAVDVSDTEALARVLEPLDVVVNCSMAYFNEAVMEACLKAGCHYTDTGGLFHWAKKQLALSERFEAAGLTAILGSGSAPGIVNVMARYAEQRLDTVEWVRIYDGIANWGAAAAPLVPPYSLDTILNEFLMSAWPFEGGEWREYPPFQGAEEVDFPEPVGAQTCYYTIHSEPATIPVAFAEKGLRECFFKLALPKKFEEKLRFLCDLGAASTEAIAVKGQAEPVVPRAVVLELVERSLAEARARAAATGAEKPRLDDHKVLRVEVRGTKAGQTQDWRLETVLHFYPEWEMPCSTFTVGYPAALTGRLLGRGAIEKKGAFGGEAAIPPEVYFSELNRRGIHVEATQKVVY